MTPRTGLYVALVGLAIAVLCGVAALGIANLASGPVETWWDYLIETAFLVYFGLFIGFMLILVGLAVAVVGTVMKPS